MKLLIEIAEKLNGKEYPIRNIKELETLAKENGIVIVFGASDDLCEFRGAIDDEVGCYSGSEAYLTSKGLLTNECECDEECPYFMKQIKSATELQINWNEDENKPNWTYSINVQHVTFNVVEDDNVYCKGICFYLKDCNNV